MPQQLSRILFRGFYVCGADHLSRRRVFQVYLNMTMARSTGFLLDRGLFLVRLGPCSRNPDAAAFPALNGPRAWSKTVFELVLAPLAN